MNFSNTIQIIALSQLQGVGSKTIIKICEVIKEQSIILQNTNDVFEFLKLAKDRKLISRLPDIDENEINLAFSAANRIIDESEKIGVNAISYLDSNYPKQLLKTVDDKGTTSFPVVLYYQGDISTASLPGIAIIGTRDPTSEGVRIGQYLASEFAKRGLNIISGLAIGCDTCAHQGALKVDGRTTAFLAHGLNTIYPSQNESLAKDIIDNNGLLMSEYPIGTTLTTYNLVARDRLQSGLANATLVIQTGKSGGTMHAANSTLAANKPLYAVKYLDAETAAHDKTAGNDYLVQRGAKYICETDDIDALTDKVKSLADVKTSLFDM